MSSTTSEEFGEPVWDIARLFPAQGAWSEDEYFSLPGNHLIEFSEGALHILPMPTYAHQLLVAFLYRALLAYLDQFPLGHAIFAPLRVKLWEGRFREPDIIFMLRKHSHRMHNRYWESADLVMEVMSPDDPKRDADTKRQEYAQAGIAEYWLINPMDETVTLFTLRESGKPYTVQAVYSRGETAASVLLEKFYIDVNQLFAEIDEQD